MLPRAHLPCAPETFPARALAERKAAGLEGSRYVEGAQKVRKHMGRVQVGGGGGELFGSQFGGLILLLEG